MNQILEISIQNRYAKVQAGVVCDDLNRALAKHGFTFPPDPASSSVATIGGNVGTNAGGIKGAKYGTTRDYVMGLQVVLPSGEVMHTGAYTMKCVSGYDLAKLFVGSEGTLGVITEVTLKINPLPRHAMTAVATFARLEDAGKAISQTMTSGVLPSVMEILDKVTLKAIKENTDIDLPQAEVMILTETDGFTWEEVEAQMEVVLGVFKQNNPSLIRTAKGREGTTRSLEGPQVRLRDPCPNQHQLCPRRCDGPHLQNTRSPGGDSGDWPETRPGRGNLRPCR